MNLPLVSADKEKVYSTQKNAKIQSQMMNSSRKIGGNNEKENA